MKNRCVIFFVFLLIMVFPEVSIPKEEIPDHISHQVGKRVFQNECGGLPGNLVSWNPGENFLSVGIGHFIWYPQGAAKPYVESFIQFIQFAHSQGETIPAFLQGPCPWNSRTSFLSAKDNLVRKKLEKFAQGTILLQTKFLFYRLNQAVIRIFAQLPPSRKTDITQKHDMLMASTEGRFAMVDYVNFKGEGLFPGESVHGEGWGLKQVLMEMRMPTSARTAVSAFAQAAERVLERRVRLDGENKKLKRWLPGWRNRVRSYADPFSTTP
jgi:hypothetical protein